MTRESMLRRSVLAAGFASCLFGIGVPTATAEVNLPAGSCGVTGVCLEFDDFNVYSLGLLQDYQKTNVNNFNSIFGSYSFLAKPNEAILNVLTFNQGTKAQGAGTSIDDPFDSITGSSGTTNAMFLMAERSLTSGQVTIPLDAEGGPANGDNSVTYGVLNKGSTFLNQTTLSGATISATCNPAATPTAGDMNNAGCIQSWDADVGALRAALNGSAFVGLFQLNEANKPSDPMNLDGQDLSAWARITLFNPGNANVAPLTFTLSGNNTLLPQQSLIQTAGVDDILPTAADEWAYVHAQICVSDSTGEVFLGDCKSAPFADGHTVSQALGADEAGFAIYNQTLDMLVRGYDFGGYTAANYTNIAIDIRLAHLTDGGDQVWFGGATAPGERVPEPSVLALLGLGLFSLALVRRRGRA